MKKLSALPLLLAVLLFSCSSDKTDNTTATTVTDSVKATPSTQGNVQDTGKTTTTPATTADNATVDFVTKAANAGMMEVTLGKVAAEKAKDQKVKDFGNMMVTDHTKANDELKGLAATKNIPMPSAMDAEHQMHVDMLSKKSGADFDKAYMDMMVKGHTNVRNEFKTASETLKDNDIKGFAARTLPVIEKHLDAAKAIAAHK